jgi:hypothetical protein
MQTSQPGRCEQMPYHEASDPAFAVKAASTFRASAGDADTVALTGSCPRCDAGMSVVVPGEMFFANRAAFLRRMLGRSRPPAVPSAGRDQEVPLVCLCTASHPGRPADRKGCGAYWNLMLSDQP